MSDVKADSTFPSMQIDPEAIDHCPLRGDSCDTPAKVQQSDYAGSFLCKLKDFLHEIYSAYEFPIHIVLSMVLAKLYPPLGAVYLAPQITASVIAVCLIFVIVGLGLKTKELSNALQRLKFNLFIQVFNFCFVSGCVFVATRLLTSIHVLNDALADGMVICSCLPIAINALIVLTASTGGDEAVAVFNTCFSNLLGIFVSPILILFYLGKSEAVDVKDIFVNLAFIVILPMFSGWLLQNYVPPARCLYATHKRRFKRMQESCLVFIIYTVFCRKFLSASSGLNAGESPAGITDVFIMIGLEFVLIAFFMNVAWAVLDIVFPDEPELRVTGLFACHHKTIALGVPLIGSMYDHHPNVALYTLPILVWHPMQLVLGSFLVPTLSSYIQEVRKGLDTRLATGETESMGLLETPTDVQRTYGAASDTM